MKRKKALLVLLMGACSLMLSCSRGWQVNINGTAGGYDRADVVTVDSAGDVVAAGVTENAGTGFDFTVIKFDGASGAELWRQVIDGTAHVTDQALAVAVDAEGNVVAAGVMINAGTHADFTVIKFDGASGVELWRQEINGTAFNSFSAISDVAFAVTVDSAGDVVAAGVTENAGTGFDFTVIKFDGVTGVELWRQIINGTANSGDEATVVAVDGAGDVVAAGIIRNTGTFPGDFTVIKFDGVSGVELWRQLIKSTAGTNAARAVTVDSAGNVIAVGYTVNTGTLDDFTVIKFDGASGVELWRQVIDGTAHVTDQALAVAVDAEGNVVAAGSTSNTGTSRDFTVIKFDGASGVELWRQFIYGTAFNSSDLARAVTVDTSGDVVAAGVTENAGTGDDFTVVKLSGVDGTVLWRRDIIGTTSGNDEARAVTVDSAGDVVAAGKTANTGTGDADFTVVKLRGIDGSNF